MVLAIYAVMLNRQFFLVRENNLITITDQVAAAFVVAQADATDIRHKYCWVDSGNAHR